MASELTEDDVRELDFARRWVDDNTGEYHHEGGDRVMALLEKYAAARDRIAELEQKLAAANAECELQAGRVDDLTAKYQAALEQRDGFRATVDALARLVEGMNEVLDGEAGDGE